MSDAIPVLGNIRIYPDGGGCPITIQTMVPHKIYNINMGGGCGVPAIRVYSDDVASITDPPTTIRVWSIDHETENGECIVRFQFGSVLGLPPEEHNHCIMWLDQELLVINKLVKVSMHRAYYDIEIPNLPELEGLSGYVQTAESVPTGGGWNGINFGNGLDIRIGNSLSACRACQ